MSKGDAGCYLIYGGDEDLYTCSVDVFKATYEGKGGGADPNEYRKIGHVIARRMMEPFSIKVRVHSLVLYQHSKRMCECMC